MKISQALFFIWITIISFPNASDARLYFMHIQKTGGTTLRLLLELQLSTEEIYPFRNPKHANAPITQNLVSGHFPYWFCKRFDKNFGDAFKVTILVAVHKC